MMLSFSVKMCSTIEKGILSQHNIAPFSLKKQKLHIIQASYWLVIWYMKVIIKYSESNI